MDEVSRLKARLQREKAARREAEEILEAKSVELYHSNLELKELTRYLESRVEERTAELTKARDEAIKNAQVKSDFLANMSHELRTPMNGVLGMLTLLKNTKLTARQTQLIGTAISSGELLLALINDILDLSKLESDKLELEYIEFDPTGLVQLSCDPFASQAQSKEIDLVLLIDPDLPFTVNGDPTRLQQIITNLVSNAIKFTNQGQVTVEVTFDDNTFILAVKDTGIGMTNAQIERIFNKFSQADESTTRKFGGTGLGLAFCQKLVDNMKGLFLVTSEYQVGSCFEVQLPMQLQVANEQPIFPVALKEQKALIFFQNPDYRTYAQKLLNHWHMPLVDCIDYWPDKNLASEYDLLLLDCSEQTEQLTEIEELVQHSQCNLISFWRVGSNIDANPKHLKLTLPVKPSELFDAVMDSLQESRTLLIEESEPQLTAQFVDAHILLVEDNIVNQEVAREMLTMFGCEVSVANNGEEALEMLSVQQFNLVLMDIQMPVMDGITATKHIREKGDIYEFLPIIALTAHSLAADRQKSLDAGMNDHITKPIELPELLRVLKQYLPTIAHIAPQSATVEANATDSSQDEVIETAIKADISEHALQSKNIVADETLQSATNISNARSQDPSSNQSNEQPTKAQATQLSAEQGEHYQSISPELALKRLLGNETLYQRVLHEFLKATEINIQDIDSAITNKDVQELTASCHSIKGSAANVSALQLSKLAAEIEHLAKSSPQLVFDDSETLSELHQQLHKAFQDCQTDIKDYLANLENKLESELESSLAATTSSNVSGENTLSSDKAREICQTIEDNIYIDLGLVEKQISRLEKAYLDENLTQIVDNLRKAYLSFDFILLQQSCEAFMEGLNND